LKRVIRRYPVDKRRHDPSFFILTEGIILEKQDRKRMTFTTWGKKLHLLVDEKEM
jgi:hypothetical protein